MSEGDGTRDVEPLEEEGSVVEGVREVDSVLFVESEVGEGKAPEG